MITAGPSLAPEDAARMRRRAIFECHKYDPQSGDVSVLAPFALRIDEATRRDLTRRAEALAREMITAERAIAADRRARRELALPLPLRGLLSSRAPGAEPPTLARYVRFDFHPTPDGWRISEANSDVPGGFGEAGGLARLMLPHYPQHAVAGDPSDALARSIVDRIGARRPVALVYATAFTDDRQVMLSIQDALAARGVESVPCGPDALTWTRGRACLEGRELGGVVRNYPAEWLPSLLWSTAWWRFYRGGRTPLANPPGPALISQNKRFPIACRRAGLDLPAWREHLPETRDPREVDVHSGDWVLKPALGRVGEDVGLPGVTPPREWASIVKSAARSPERWIAQRVFETVALETPQGAMYPCVGVFVVDGRAAGLYGRLGRTPLVAGDALEVAVLVDRAPVEGGRVARVV